MEQVKSSKKLKLHKLGKAVLSNKTFYAMLIPGIVLTFIFSYMPMYGIVLAFKKYSIRKGILGSEWVGWLNFKNLFDVPQFWLAFRNTVLLNVLKLVFAFPVPIILALMINSVTNKYVKKTVQTVLYLPHFVSWVVVAGVVFSLLDPDGAIYSALALVGVKDFDILANDGSFLALLVITDIWKEAGWSAIIYLAALLSISGEYYEAAKVDGASAWKILWAITLPLLLPTVSIMLILQIGGLVSGGMDQVYNLYNEQVYDIADNLATFSYRFGIGEGNFEIGTAIGLFSNVINVALLIGANKLTKVLGGEALY